MSKSTNSAQLCTVPDAVQFQFREEQEMHSEITISNLVDRVVNFKIKTNKPGLYLVKPMEGQIYNKSTAKISFKRKELTLDNFNIILANPGQNREKFLIQFSSEYEDGVGITQKANQVAYLAVTFNRGVKQNDDVVQSILKPMTVFKEEKEVGLDKQIAEKKAEFQSLVATKQSLLAARSSSNSGSGFTLQDLIYTIIFSFMLGFILL